MIGFLLLHRQILVGVIVGWEGAYVRPVGVVEIGVTSAYKARQQVLSEVVKTIRDEAEYAFVYDVDAGVY